MGNTTCYDSTNTPTGEVRGRVISRAPDPKNPELMVLNLGNGRVFHERRFMPVSKGDEVRRINGSQWVKLRKMEGEIKNKPIWSHTESLSINGGKIPLTIKEIETASEMREYQLLTRFHYRGNMGVGRRVPLIAQVDRWNLPKIVGFVELSSSMLVNVARKKILDAPFDDSNLNIHWDRWDMETAKKFNNALVRISRCVIYPELRGLGLAAKLTDAAIEYARNHWHIGGMRPCFIEIVAEMLRYWPFVEKSGFVNVGETQGNTKRAPEAMAYLLGRKKNAQGYPKGGGGIMSMHRKHAEKLAQIQAKTEQSIDEIVKLLAMPPEKLGKAKWLLLHDIYRRKKPTYMLGLTKSAQNHLHAQIQSTHSVVPRTPVQKKRAVSVRNMNITASIKPRDCERCRKIQEAFGIVSDIFKTTVIRDFSTDFNAGEICLITGASGVGKSLLLEGIRHVIGNSGAKLPQGIKIKGKNEGSKVRIARLITPPRHKSPIELLGKHSLDDAMRILARAGLAEAQLFVRPVSSMSVGQSYRLALALALAKKPDIVMIDEFCEPLDEYTSAAVCRKIRGAAKKGICFLVATADARKVRAELRPHRILLLSANGEYSEHKTRKRSV